MAKDPAFLFYPNDYLGGTLGMSFEQKGAYIEILMMQFNRGHMTNDMILHMLFGNAQLWESIKGKFSIDSDGLFFNTRLEIEQNKRKEYSESRRKNKAGKAKEENHMINDMSVHMEDENRDIVISYLPVLKKEKKEVYSFDDFWTDYGKKEDRKKCETKWKSITEKQKAEIKMHVPLYVQSTPEIQYRKNPSTYLNNECWNNEIIQRGPVQLPPPNLNPSYEKWDGKKRWLGSTEIPYNAPPRPSNLAKWDTKQNKWIYSNF